MTNEQLKRYEAAAHKVQTGVAVLLERGAGEDDTPKHLRVGLNLRAADQAGLAQLLIEKGIITADEYTAAMVKATEAEAERIQRLVQEALGPGVVLG